MKLFSNSAFVLMLVTGVLSVYVITGVFINMPRYFEIHYHMPAFKANLGAGKCLYERIYMGIYVTLNFDSSWMSNRNNLL